MYQFPAVRRQENSSFANFGFVSAGAVCKCAVLCVDCSFYRFFLRLVGNGSLSKNPELQQF